jgi:hypothetical protein
MRNLVGGIDPVLVQGGRLSADSGVSRLELKESFGFLTDQGTFASV